MTFWIIFAAQYVLGGIAYAEVIKRHNKKCERETRCFMDLCNAFLEYLREFPIYGQTVLEAQRYHWILGNHRLDEITEVARFLYEEGIIEKVEPDSAFPFYNIKLRIKK